MVRTALLLTLGLATASAFQTVQPTARTETQLYGGSSGFATTVEGKKVKVDAVKELLDTSQMIFSVPAGEVTVAESQTLRRSMPEGTTISVVKNTLMRRATEGTEYEEATAPLLKGPNMWFFIEEDIGASIKAWNAFTKEAAKTETHSINGGIVEGTNYDAAGIEAIGKLPSKKELYAKIAAGVNAVPTKLARVIKAPNSKLARAIKLATVDEQSE
uniref:50S ribosomal protein L10 n=1 Tax=Pseudo-nitzschia australis TaxID=44445 RepID=A0A7S4EQC8_9STRA|mmetsp:Transcript_8101/g.17456  ORF Transcript_8101/g.17456 Transcript_8101/m.17456 type:complete len:216 (+) Transcript_8101:164-811(+)|eukprot:CAMPEP_0168173852 /NCGR_PEP_ID=MMETSP0139_2-20121125/6149_1 /TAXON_ID=44445 /ORGANISM="Pseudo-nitzschia australis, Strain 10249 10 AB" /LENGTH=215 /DNA_ID=CAMNT_0008091879 /DNA_START=107 /DNA_END=754 /DNA_ORIENTATION=+